MGKPANETARTLRSLAQSCRNVAASPMRSRTPEQWKLGVADGLRLAATLAEGIADSLDMPTVIDAEPDAILARAEGGH